MTQPPHEFNRAAAVTRSLLGWGVVAGPCYLLVGVVLGSTRPGFDFTRHALSLLMLGHVGWIQRINFTLCGVMVIAAGAGMLRAIRDGRGLAVGGLVITGGSMLVVSAIFTPDPMNGFPIGVATTTPSASGLLHLIFGAVQFIALAAAAVAFGSWSRTIGRRRLGVLSFALAGVILVGFVGGAALGQHSAGIGLLWIAVVCEWVWLAIASVRIYQWSPHPVQSSSR